MHEIGHAFQPAINETLVRKDTNEIILGNTVRFDFDEFLSIAGWRAKRSGYRLIDDDHVRIDGKDYPLDTAVNFKGTTVTFRMADYDQEKLLYICRVEGDPEFGKGFNSKYSPSEHWANAIMMYYFSPTAMRQIMPKAYRYFQDNLSVYYPDPLPKVTPESKIYKALQDVKEFFIKLSHIEQSFILQTLIKDTDISATGNSFHAVSELSALSESQRIERFVLILSKYPNLIDDKLTRILNQLVEINAHRKAEITSIDTDFLA
jgi:hypothetical protein